ncbi:ATP-binding protein [Candidatus Pacearchaeota archaeon]|nr:ATP-binding protein [Candidatus Pacearchaeota archaeon]
MVYDIVLGRDASDKERFGDKGLIFLGKGYVKMGNTTSLSNKIWLDVARSHVILIAGKRGTGKSYTLAAIAEELSNLPEENAQNIAPFIFDTMGIFWTMKYENQKERPLLDKWGLKTKSLPVKVFIPFGKQSMYDDKGIPYDSNFALKVSEIEADDWISLFNLNMTSLHGVLIQRVVTELKSRDLPFTLDDIQRNIEQDESARQETKEVASALFKAAETWGIFSKTEGGTELKDLITAGTTTVLDISTYSSTATFNIRALVISLLSRKMFQDRMDSRKREELEAIQQGQEYLSATGKRDKPLIWIFIDEMHEFMPKDAKTPATDALMQLLREGRQPGISLVMATQQPGQIHRDVMTQSDIVIAHRLTAKPDIDALNEIMQTYLLENIRQQMDDLPSEKGSAILLDDNSERLYPLRVRPRFTWHGGEAPVSIRADLLL